MSLNYSLEVNVKEYYVDRVVKCLDHDPHFEMATILSTQSEHQYNQNNEETAAALVGNLLLDPVQILLLLYLPWIQMRLAHWRNLRVLIRILLLSSKWSSMRNLWLLATLHRVMLVGSIQVVAWLFDKILIVVISMVVRRPDWLDGCVICIIV